MAKPEARVAIPGDRLIKAIFWAGLVGGVLDLAGAMAVYGPILGTPATPERILQSVASGLLGRKAFEGGWLAAGIGLTAHMAISFAAAAVYVGASQWLSVLLSRPIVSGLLFGAAVYVVMTQIVVPLSAAVSRPPSSFKMFLIASGLNVFLFGLPVALAARMFAKSPRPSVPETTGTAP
jgi:uncharacterized membrane protein YagU involved in acid resistance